MTGYSHKKLKSLYHNLTSEDTISARIYLDKMLSNATKVNNSYHLSETSILLASLENRQGNYTAAKSYIENAIALSKSINNEDLTAQGFFMNGRIGYHNGDYENAVKAYVEALKYYQKISHKRMMSDISHNIALIKSELGNQDEALQILLKNYHDSKDVSKEIRDKEFGLYFYTNTLMTLSNVYIRKADKAKTDSKKQQLLDSASIYNLLGYHETLKDNDIIGNVYFINGEGMIRYEKGLFDEAIEKLRTAIEKIKKLNHPSLLTSAYYYKGLSHRKLNQTDIAITHLKKIDSISKKNNINYPTLQGTYYTLAQIYKEHQDSVNILKYQNLYIENDRINEHINETVRQEIHKKYDIALLNSEIETLTNTSKKDKNRYTKAIVIIFILITSFTIFFLFYKKQQRKNKLAFEKLMQQLESKKTEVASKSNTSKGITIDNEKLAQIIEELERFEENKLFLDKSCDLSFVAKQVKTNKAYLSKVIHSHKQQKFVDYIRGLRINYALQRLKDDKVFRSYDIKSIAEESGFKSSDTFSRAFVKNTGIYPSYYITSINKKQA
ncbi:AraC family transcriptional regulator [Kordia sp.]|uniref:AraC family transcriptional regulator n=1 Tax=Kordia sp. TaxID=1965332 RepID=UPI0025C670C1|nr:AraC family transcriptional regulator [Kordia sp.]MCH2194678.1 helix-turn-helix domain-containing protein [Kordia sp.]